METITLRVDKEFSKEIERSMHPYYSTKTEFIREAIRDKIKRIRKEENALRR
ncbi:MAG: hypothetical protein ACLFTR_05330 [Candidatus Woesearchaeota archaeon]